VLELRRLPGPIEAAPDMPFEGDHARDQDDHARDQADRDGDHSRIRFERKPGHKYAENYPDLITGHPLQTHPTKAVDEFDSIGDWLEYQDALTRWTN
jgi:hypothetical protein